MRVLLTGLAAIGLLAAPIATTGVTLAATQVALACPADAPEGWKRPGGYCEQRNTLDTIGTEKGTGGVSCRRDADIGTYFDGPLSETLSLTAEIYDPCCDTSAASPRAYLPDGMVARSDETVLVAIC